MKLPRLRPIHRAALVIVLLAAVLLTEITTSTLIAANDSDDPSCDYILRLREAEQRSRFISLRQQMHEITQRMAAEPRSRVDNAIPTDGKKQIIDDESNRCLDCHDNDGGVKHHGPPPSPPFDNTGMVKVTRSHPVGLPYEKKSLANSYLHSSASFPLNMVLIYGRLSCITCHDPLNQEGDHLAGINRSALCVSCHDTDPEPSR